MELYRGEMAWRVNSLWVWSGGCFYELMFYDSDGERYLRELSK